MKLLVFTISLLLIACHKEEVINTSPPHVAKLLAEYSPPDYYSTRKRILLRWDFDPYNTDFNYKISIYRTDSSFPKYFTTGTSSLFYDFDVVSGTTYTYKLLVCNIYGCTESNSISFTFP